VDGAICQYTPTVIPCVPANHDECQGGATLRDWTSTCSNAQCTDSFEDIPCAETCRTVAGGDDFCSCVRYVDGAVGASGDGTSWATAFQTVQEGIDSAALVGTASSPCQVWVAQGTYYQYQSGTSDTLHLADHVEVYGGFAGSEAFLGERNWTTNVTELSGYNQAETNQVYHVVTSTTDSVLDGLVISDGQADGSGPDARGAAIDCRGGSLVVRNCTVRENHADYAATINGDDGCNLEIRATAIHGNFAGRGSGVYVEGGTHLLENCAIYDNEGVYGPVFNSTGDLEMVNTTVVVNTAGTGLFGTLYVSGGLLTVTNSIIWHNDYNNVSSTGTVEMTYTAFEGGYTGTGNIADNPLLGSIISPFDLQLSSGSPCIDAASSAAAPATDILGNSRVGPPDMGAYEYQF
jgi:hypothetical protein